jgi:predicted nucleic acid-binding protein
MILVDSSVWIDYFNGVINAKTDTLDELLGKQLIITGDLIMLEVLQGFKSDKDFKQAKNLFEQLPFYSISGKDIALEAVNHYRYLRSKGITVRKTIDVLIATFCIMNDFHLLHSDRDFDVFSQFLNLKYK